MISPVKIWRRQKEIKTILGKTGTIVSWTKIFIAGSGFKKYAPYPVVMVKLDSGGKAYGQLVDYSANDLKTGSKVKAVLRKVREGSKEGVIAYGIKFKPI